MHKPFHPQVEGFPAWLLPFLFLVTTTVYLFTLNPSLFRNDSPETITACVTLGVSHPPSYPLHTLLGRLFSFIPLGNPAMAINFFSALLGAFGACLFALNLWFLLKPPIPKAGAKTSRLPLIAACLAGSLCFAFSKSYWSASLASKGGIYIFQIVLELSLVLGFQFWAGTSGVRKVLDPGFLCLITFVFSLGLTNHWPTQVLLVPAMIVTTFAGNSTVRPWVFKPFRLKQALTGFTILFLVTSLYLVLPLRSHLYPRLNFGAPFTFHRFADSLLRINYFKTETLASFIPTALSTIEKKADYISAHFLGEFIGVFLFFSLSGVYSLLNHGRKLDLLFLLLLLLTTILANLFYLQVLPIEYWHLDDHLLTLNWVTALLSSSGLYFLFAYFLKRSSKWPGKKISAAAGLILVGLLPLSSLLKNLPTNDQKKEFLFQGYGMEVLKPMERNSLYFAESDYDYFSLLYLTEVEHWRSDVGLFLVPFLSKAYQYNLLQRDPRLNPLIPVTALSGQAAFFQWLANPPSGCPVYCAFPNGPFEEMFLLYNGSLSFRPVGLAVRIHPSRKALSSRAQIALLDDFWTRYLISPNRSTSPINGLFLDLCAHPYLNTVNYLRAKGDLSFWDWGYAKALTLIQNKSWLAETWANWAEGEQTLGRKLTAIHAYRLSAADYLNAGCGEEARLSLQKALALAPTDSEIRRMLDNLRSPKK